MENTIITEEVREVTETPDVSGPAADPTSDEVSMEGWTSVEFQSAADKVLAAITEKCLMSLAAYTNPKSEPSYEEIGKQLDKLAERYNFYSRAAAFCLCVESDTPSLKAVELLGYNTVSVSEKTINTGISKLHQYQHKLKSKRFSLRKVEEYCAQNGKTFAPSSEWYATVEKLCCVLTLAHAKELGIPAEKIGTIDASFNMRKIAREVVLAEEDPTNPNPLSKSQIAKNLTLVLSRLVGESYHADTRDAAFLKMCFSGQGRESLSAKTANSTRLADIILQIAHRSCFDKSYTIQAATKKERKA